MDRKPAWIGSQVCGVTFSSLFKQCRRAVLTDYPSDRGKLFIPQLVKNHQTNIKDKIEQKITRGLVMIYQDIAAQPSGDFDLAISTGTLSADTVRERRVRSLIPIDDIYSEYLCKRQGGKGQHQRSGLIRALISWRSLTQACYGLEVIRFIVIFINSSRSTRYIIEIHRSIYKWS